MDQVGKARVLAANEDAKKKNLMVAVGLQRHHDPRYVETVKRLRDGEKQQGVRLFCLSCRSAEMVRKGVGQLFCKRQIDLIMQSGRKIIGETQTKPTTQTDTY
jgi:ribosomal protein L37AE/L43A